MSSAHLHAVCVPTSEGKYHEVIWNKVEQERPEIEARRDEMLAIVHEEVERYIYNPDLCCDTMFPRPSDMTGHYYVARESYFHPSPDYDPQPDPWIQISVMTKFLGRFPTPSGIRVDDYLGLEVWLRWTPRKKAFVIFRNTDSSVA